MANIRGVGGSTGRNLVGTARMYPSKTAGRPPYYIVDAQVDMRDPKCKDVKETNPHLESHKFHPADAPNETRVAHGRTYTQKQFDAIAAAGQTREGKDGVIEFAVKADLMVKAPKEGDGPEATNQVMINTAKPMGKSDFKLGPKTMENQAKARSDMKALVAAERESEKQAGAETPAPEAQAEAGVEMQ